MSYPVLAAHSITCNKARELNLLRIGIHQPKAQRDGYSRLARSMVALSVKMDRMSARIARGMS